MDARDEIDGDLLRATIAEARADRGVDREHILDRLQDWQDRVHRLYDFIEHSLGDKFTYDRAGKSQSGEELVQRAGLQPQEVPAVDILRIERHDGSVRAMIVPRGLWIIGANGRLDLRVIAGAGGRQQQFFLVDMSRPMSGVENAFWHIVSPLARLDTSPLTADRLRELLDN